MFDANGNVGQLVDSSNGTIAAHYEYDPFGKLLVATGSEADSNVFRFSTKYYDVATGLYYYGRRYYDPELGRWRTRDPIGEDGGLNLYGFVSNQPTNFIDADGRLVYVFLDWFLDPLRYYDLNTEYTVSKCHIEILVGHYTETTHKILTEECAGVTLHGCMAGGGVKERTGLPDVPIPPKEITPFPGSYPLATEIVLANDPGLARVILADFRSAQDYARDLCMSDCGCKCGQITISIKLLFSKWGPFDRAIRRVLTKNGVTEKTVTWNCH